MQRRHNRQRRPVAIFMCMNLYPIRVGRSLPFPSSIISPLGFLPLRKRLLLGLPLVLGLVGRLVDSLVWPAQSSASDLLHMHSGRTIPPPPRPRLGPFIGPSLIDIPCKFYEWSGVIGGKCLDSKGSETGQYLHSNHKRWEEEPVPYNIELLKSFVLCVHWGWWKRDSLFLPRSVPR